jgi:hypothetical protein
MENQLLLKIGDNFFFVFHIALIIFNLFGWIPKKLRKWNLVSLSLTAFSWFVLGIFYGFGYCFLTEWHWQIRESLGRSNESNSYIHFLLVELFGASISERVVDIFTGILFFAALIASLYVNFKGKNRDPKSNPPAPDPSRVRNAKR